MSRTTDAQTACPCDSARAYGQCCGPLHAGQPATTAEQLMRSRYSAFVLGLTDYLRASWHPDTCPDDLSLAESPPRQWLGLSIRQHQQQDADHARVEFIARFKINGRAYRLHETSRFVRDASGHWRYRDGDIHSD